MSKTVASGSRVPVGALVVVGALLLGGALRASALATPRYLDDHAQLAMLEHRWPIPRSGLDLFAFVRPGERDRLAEVGGVPWWTSSRFSFAMGRPLASALTLLDHAVFGAGVRGPHLHSLAWWAALVLCASAVYRRVLAPGSAAVATVLYAVDEAHTLPVAWLANRCVLVATAVGLLGVLAHIRWRTGTAGARWLPVAGCFLAAALGGEYAACALAYIVAWEAIVARDDLRTRLLALLPAVVPVALVLGAYRLAGYGTSGSQQYIDPLRNPGGFVSTALGRVPTLLADQLCTRSADGPSLAGLLLGSGPSLGVAALAVLAVTLALRTHTLDGDARRRLAWLGVGGLVALLPVTASIPSSRLLVASGVGFSGCLGALVEGAWGTFRRDRPGGFPAVVTWPVCCVAAVVHLGVAPWRTVTESRFVSGLLTRERAAIVRSAPPAGTTLVVALAVGDPETLHYAPLIWREAGRPAPDRWAVLSMAPGPLVLVRPDAFTLEIRALGVPLLASPLEDMYLSPGYRAAEGDDADGPGFVATVEETDDGHPRQLRFHFEHELDAAGTVVVTATQQGLVRIPLPGIHGGIAVPPPFIPGF